MSILVTNIIQWLSWIYGVTAGISIVSNIVMIYIISRKSPKKMGAYKHLMMILSVFEIFYSLIDVIMVPVHFSVHSAIIVMSTATHELLSPWFLSALDNVYWGLFGASLALFAVNFIYRYLAISQHKLLSTFNSWKLILWMLIPFVIGVIWGLTSEFFSYPSKELADFVRKDVFETFGKDIDDIVYRAVFLYNTGTNGELSMRPESVFTLGLHAMCNAFSISIITYFGIKCYYRITSVLKLSTSCHHQTLQKQLFYALVIQTLIPLVLMHSPVMIMFSYAFSNIGLGPYSAFVTISITCYPAIDPLPNFVIIKPYREAIQEFFGCRKAGKAKISQVSSDLYRMSSST